MPHRRAYRCGIFPLYIIYYYTYIFPSNSTPYIFIYYYIYLFFRRGKRKLATRWNCWERGAKHYIRIFLKIDCNQEISLRAHTHTHTRCPLPQFLSLPSNDIMFDDIFNARLNTGIAAQQFTVSSTRHIRI